MSKKRPPPAARRAAPQRADLRLDRVRVASGDIGKVHLAG
jgi:hypothetical protein